MVTLQGAGDLDHAGWDLQILARRFPRELWATVIDSIPDPDAKRHEKADLVGYWVGMGIRECDIARKLGLSACRVNQLHAKYKRMQARRERDKMRRERPDDYEKRL